MKSTKGRYLIVMLCLLFSLSKSSLAIDPPSFDVSDDEIEAFIDYILCDFNVTMTEADLQAVLDGLIEPEDLGCEPVEPELLSLTSNSAYFEWAPVAGAEDYTVASIGLTDGVVFQDFTLVEKYNFTGLTAQQYLFVFISNCIGDVSSIAEIVIVDMDVYYPSQNYSILDYCRCRPGTPSFNPLPSCPFYTNQETYAWGNGSCLAKKYRFSLTGIDSPNYPADIWIFNNTSSEGVSLSSLNCSDFIIEESGVNGFTVSDPGKFEVILTSTGAHFYLENTDIDITATKCGCFNNITQGRLIDTERLEQEAAFEVTPNPFSDFVSVSAPIQQDGEANITLVAMDGSIVSTRQVAVEKGVQTFDVNTATLATGVYSVIFESDHERYVKRVVKL